MKRSYRAPSLPAAVLSLFLAVGSALSAQSVPAPADVFGFEPGADYKLASHGQIVDYFRQLDEASDRVEVVEIGQTVLGRPMILAFVSSEENIRQLDRWREISARLARAEDLSPGEARRLAEEGRAIVWIDGGLHSTEVAGAQHTSLLAHRVATEESAEMRQIRDNVVMLLMPVMNPDGLEIVRDWYGRNLETPYELTGPPILYHHYVGHDNNRDWYMVTQPETRAVTDVLYHEWYPQIVLNQHQTAPFPARIFIPPFSDPVNPNIPPLVVRGVNLVGEAMGSRFSDEGKPGAIARVTFDMWWNGGMRTVPYFHNMVGLLTETAHASASPRYYDPETLPRYIGTVPADHPSIFYPDPWEGGWFRLRDAVDYMVTAAMATLDIGAELKEDWLYNAYRLGRDAIEAGAGGGPYAYIIPPEQWNPREAVELVNVLREGGVEVRRASREFAAGGGRYPAGSYVVPAAQAFRPYLVDLLEKQVYPDMRLYPDGPPDPPYDVSGWTLPMQMHVGVDRIDEPFPDPGLEPVDMASVEPGAVTDGSWGWILSHRPNASALAVNRLLESGARVSWASGPVTAGGISFDAGAIVIRESGSARSQVRQLAAELGLDFVGVDGDPGTTLHRLERPRIGLYKSWVANMDEGWTRFILENYEFPVDTLHDADIRQADLDRYHAIIIPDQDPARVLHGHRPGSMPEEYVGGIGLEGMTRLQRYVEGGGTLVALDAATNLLIEQFGLPVEDVTADRPFEDFFIPGTLIRLDVETDHPLGYGMPAEAAAFFRRSRAFAIDDPTGRVEVVARYSEEDQLLSGWALGEDEVLPGRAAVVRARMGSGNAVLIGFRAQFRAQPRGTYKLLFNALHGATLETWPRSATTEE